MNYLLNCFRFYIKLHCVVVVFWLVYLLLNFWEVIRITPPGFVIFMWIHLVYFILSILYIVNKYLIQRKRELIKLDIFLIVLCNTIFFIVFLIDPFYLLEKAHG